MMKVKNLFIVFLLAACAMFACAGTDPWIGTYSYEASLGETVAGEGAVVTYTLVVAANKCSITIEGFQVSEAIICKTNSVGSHLDVTFQSYDNGAILNKYGISVYKPNDSLVQLEREQELITTWGKLLPDEALAKKGKYFKKLK